MKWAWHVERMNEDRLPMMAYVHQEKGSRKEQERETVPEMARLHREGRQEDGVGGQRLENGDLE